MPIIRRKKTGGRITHPIIKAFVQRYNLTEKQKEFLIKNIVQISLCHGEEERRLILGVSA
jgi:hypothetical protein